MSDIGQVKQSLLGNRFAYRLRVEAVADEASFAALVRDLRTLSDLWRDELLVDKALAGWIAHVALTVAGAEEDARRRGAAQSDRLGQMLGDLYTALEECFAEDPRGP